MITQNKFKEIDFFDNFAKSREYDVLTPFGYNSIIRDFRRLIGDRLSQGRKAIDLGCGTGIFARALFCKDKADLFGLDISLNSVQVASKKIGKKICYLTGDIENLCFKDRVFDVVVFSGVLHHFTNIEYSLKEGHRILKKGGCMLSYDPNIKNLFMWLYRHHSSPFFSKSGRTDNERLLSAKEVNIMMKRIGFINVDTHCISGVTFKYVESRIGRLLLFLYNAIDILFSILPLANRYGSFLICYGEKS